MKPKRIQRKRTKGWKMPENAIAVTRPGPEYVVYSGKIAGISDKVDLTENSSLAVAGRTQGERVGRQSVPPDTAEPLLGSPVPPASLCWVCNKPIADKAYGVGVRGSIHWECYDEIFPMAALRESASPDICKYCRESKGPKQGGVLKCESNSMTTPPFPELWKLLDRAKVRYSRDHGMPNPSEPFPTHVEFDLATWKAICDVRSASPEAPAAKEK